MRNSQLEQLFYRGGVYKKVILLTRLKSNVLEIKKNHQSPFKKTAPSELHRSDVAAMLKYY